MKYYVLLGGPEHLEYFQNPTKIKDEQWWWTVSPSAKIGETAFIYLTAPESRIVGRVELIGEPFHNVANIFENQKCDGKWMAPIGNVVYYPPRPELTMKGLRSLFGSDWAWLSYPRGKTTIPDHILTPFLELVETANEGR